MFSIFKKEKYCCDLMKEAIHNSLVVKCGYGIVLEKNSFNSGISLTVNYCPFCGKEINKKEEIKNGIII